MPFSGLWLACCSPIYGASVRAVMVRPHPSPGDPGKSMLDDRRLKALEAAGGPERIQPLIQLFAETVETRWAELRLLDPNGDLDVLQAAAHDIAGSAGNFGARRVEVAARQVIAACADKDRDAVRTGVEALGPLLEQTLEELRQRYGLKRS